MSTPLEYKTLRIWQFTTEKMEANPRPGFSPQMKRKTYGVLSPSFDDAFKLLREKHPDVRIAQVLQHDINVDYLVTSPEAWAVAERLAP